MGSGLELLLATAIISTGVSIQQGRQAQKQQEKAAKAQAGIAEIENRRARVKMIRESQAQQANLENMAVAENVEGGTGFQGAMAAQMTNTASALGDFDQTQTLQRRSTTAMTKASRATANGQLAQGIASIGYTGFQAYGGMDTLRAKYPDFFKA